MNTARGARKATRIGQSRGLLALRDLGCAKWGKSVAAVSGPWQLKRAVGGKGICRQGGWRWISSYNMGELQLAADKGGGHT